VIAGYAPFFETIVPGDISSFKVFNRRLPDSYIKILFGTVISKTKEARSSTIITLTLGLTAE
jgi:hypothetical protein